MVSASQHICKYLMLEFPIVFLVPSQLVYVEGQETATLSGIVLDENEEPIEYAIIRILGPRSILHQAKTDSSGSFQILVNQEGWYLIYAMCNLAETPRVDYVPSLWKTYLQPGSKATFTFALERGASLYLEGEMRFVESSEPADYCRFTRLRILTES